MSDQAIQGHAQEVAERFCGRALVYLAPGGVKLADAWIASAVPLVTPRGCPFLLSAKHNLFDDEGNPQFKNLRLGHRDRKASVEDGVRDAWPHPDNGVDVALALPSDEAAQLIRTIAVGAANVEPRVLETPYEARASGWPRSILTASRDGENSVTVHARPIVYGTFVDGTDDKGRLRIRWGSMVPTADAVAQVPHLGFKVGEEVRMVDPRGVSGGGVWVFESPKSATWTADATARLVGILRGWNERDTELADPTARWFAWFQNAVAQLDAGGETSGPKAESSDA